MTDITEAFLRIGSLHTRLGKLHARLASLEKRVKQLEEESWPPANNERKGSRGAASLRVESTCVPPAPADVRLSKLGGRIERWYCDSCAYSSVSPTVVEQHEEREHPKVRVPMAERRAR